MLGLYASLVPGFVERPKPFVPEGLDHQKKHSVLRIAQQAAPKHS
jgi:hypothetical protein